MNDKFAKMQYEKNNIAETGNKALKSANWIIRASHFAQTAAAVIGFEDPNTCGIFASIANGNDDDECKETKADTKRKAAAQYGTLGRGTNKDRPSGSDQPFLVNGDGTSKKRTMFALSSQDEDSDDSTNGKALITTDSLSSRRLDVSRHSFSGNPFIMGNEVIGPDSHPVVKNVLDNTGLDFLVDGCLFVNQNIGEYVDEVIGTTMSATGFVTFMDLASVTSAASAPLTHKPQVLKVRVAPEPRDILWKNAHIDERKCRTRHSFANVFLGLGAIAWSVPVVAIQALSTAESLSRIPFFNWLLASGGGRYTAFINGYLPVVALLCMILLLPIIFEQVAVRYENIKTKSGVERSILSRYFYYQVANIYITVTAGSIWDSLADILNHPSSVLNVLGRSLPAVVGYFISLLVTKILAGLPMVLLRVGAVSRLLFLRTIYSQVKLTQRELDEVYRPQVLLYGWEYPTQLLVIMICFTYACISPIILPVGALYFGMAMIVYKKQVLYVYTPAYESGGALFPVVLNRTLMGLICAQLTLIGYTMIRQGHYQPLSLLPLPIITVWMMGHFRENYADTSEKLSMERAIELDKRFRRIEPVTSDSDLTLLQDVTHEFTNEAYRQPVLTEGTMYPLPYRYGIVDSITTEVDGVLKDETRRYYRAMADSIDSNDSVGGYSDQNTSAICVQ